MRAAIAAVSILLAIPGLVAVARIDTFGLHRNAVTAIPAPRGLHRRAPGDGRLAREPLRRTGERGPDESRGAARGANVILIALESTAAWYPAPYGAKRLSNAGALATGREVDPVPARVRGVSGEHQGTFRGLVLARSGIRRARRKHMRMFRVRAAAVACAAGYRTALFHSGRFAYLGMQALVDRLRDMA